MVSRLVNQVLDAAPRSFELLEGRVVQNFVQLERDQPVDLRDARLDRRFRIPGQRHLALQNLIDELLDHVAAALESCWHRD